MRRIILVFYLFISGILFSQNYHPFASHFDTIALEDKSDLIRFVRLDSTSISGYDTIFYFNKEIGYNRSVLKCPDFDAKVSGPLEESLLYGSDTLSFRSGLAEIGFNPQYLDTTWRKAGEIASVIDYDLYVRFGTTIYDTVHTGTLDSIRQYHIKAIDSTGRELPVSNIIHLDLSKTHGIQSFPLYVGISHYSPKDYNKTRFRRFNMSRRSVYNFDVGDEFQYYISEQATNSITFGGYETWLVTYKNYPNTSNVNYSFTVTVKKRIPDYNAPTGSPPFKDTIYTYLTNRTYAALDQPIVDYLTWAVSPYYTEWKTSGDASCTRR